MSIYSRDAPVAGPGRFFGRDVLVRSVVAGVQQGRSFAICGGPKTGRTSILDQVTGLVEQRWHREPRALKTVPVRLDLADLHVGGPKMLAKQLWAKMRDAVLSPRVFGDGKPIMSVEPDFARASDPWVIFVQGCEDLWTDLGGTSGWCNWTLILDNGDFLLGHKLNSVLEPLSWMVQSKVSGTPSSLVITIGRAMRERLRERRSPLRWLRLALLGPFRDAEAEALVRSGFPKAQTPWLRKIYSLTGKHPHLLQNLLSLMETASLDLDQAAAELEPIAHQMFETVWSEIDLDRGVTYRGAYAAPEHALMQYALDVGGEIDLRRAERDLGIKPLTEFAQMFEYLGVMEKVLRQDSPVYLASCQLFNRWYADRVLR